MCVQIASDAPGRAAQVHFSLAFALGLAELGLQCAGWKAQGASSCPFSNEAEGLLELMSLQCWLSLVGKKRWATICSIRHL